MSELSDASIINKLNVHDESNYKLPNDDLNENNIDEWLSEYNSDIHNANNIMAQYKNINASTLKDENPPNSLRGYNRICHDDENIWDRVYVEEYYGLRHTTTIWDYISETEYKSLVPILGKVIPTFVISVVKKKEEGKPIGAKYRIFVLGNLDPTVWSKSD